MTIERFLESLSSSTPPQDISPALLAVWLDHKELWDDAHETIQHEHDTACAAVHAYLHRKEGDTWNANYWYRNAKRKPFQGSLKDEWEHLIREECERLTS